MTPAHLDQTLGEYLKAAAGLRWAPGRHDCTAWPARWAGIAVPEYSSDQEAFEMMADAGGLVSLWTAYIGETLPRCEAPEPGDIAVVELVSATGEAEAGAIFTGIRWAVLCPRGIASLNAKPLAIWRVPCRKP